MIKPGLLLSRRQLLVSGAATLILGGCDRLSAAPTFQQFLAVAFQPVGVVEQRRPIATEAVIQVAVLTRVADEDAVGLANVEVDLGLGQEIARRLRVPIGTVMSRISRGRRLLQERLRTPDRPGASR